MKKLKIPGSLTTLAYDSIKAHILDGRLDEDARLHEEFLSTQLGISKSPIREALNRLEAEGLIQIEPRRGAHLRRLSTQDVNNLYDLREALETLVARTARVTPELLDELQRSVKRQRALLKANDRARYIEEDVHFHAELARATGNMQLCSILENIQNQIWLSRRKTYQLSSHTAPDDHESIVQALEANDREKAETAMRNHILSVRDAWVTSREPKLDHRQVG